jgi:hypothetical protein
MSCGGGFGGCGFTSGGGIYTKSSTNQTNDVSDRPEYQLFAVIVGWTVLFALIVSGIFLAAEIAEAQTGPSHGHSNQGLLR